MNLLQKAIFGLALAVLPIKAEYHNLYVGDSVTYQGSKVKTVDCHAFFNSLGTYEQHSLLSIDDYLYNNIKGDTSVALNGLHYSISNGDKFYSGINLDSMVSSERKPIPRHFLLSDNKGRDTIINDLIMRFDTVLDAEKQVKMWIDNQNLTMSKDSSYTIDGKTLKPSLLWGWIKNTTQLPQRYFVRLDFSGDTSYNKKKIIVPITGSRTCYLDNDSCNISVLSQPDKVGYMKMLFNGNTKDTVLACTGSQLRDISNFCGVVDSIRENGGNKYAVFEVVLLNRDGKRNYVNLKEGWKVGFGSDSSLIQFFNYDSLTGQITFADDMFYPKGYVTGKVGDEVTTKDGLKVLIESTKTLKNNRIVVLKAISLDKTPVSINRIPHKNVSINQSRPILMYDIAGRKLSCIPRGYHIVKKAKNIKLILH